MALTPEGTPYVESTDLVANYPAASLSLANRVDLVGILPFATSAARATAIPSPTDGQYSYLQDSNSTEFWNGSAWVAAGTAPGLVHINTTTFSAVSSVSVNDVFTSTYDNYLMLIELTAGSAVVYSARMRLSGTDATGTDYNHQLLSANATTVDAVRTTAATKCDIGIVALTPQRSSAQVHIYNPFLTLPTLFISHALQQSNQVLQRNYYGAHNVSTSYDGLTILPASSNFTGTLRIYGYKNS